MGSELVQALTDLEEAESLQITTQRLESNENPLDILMDARDAMKRVGKNFENGIYFMPELIMAGEIMKQITELVKPKLSEEPQQETLGKVIIGTVEGDIHDIGKDIVVFMLELSGYEVIDLGVDVPAQNFVDKIKETGAKVVGLSGFLTMTYNSMKKTIETIEAAGLRDQVKVIIGGGVIDETVMDFTGADAFGKDATAAISFAELCLGGA